MQDMTLNLLDRVHATLLELARDVRALDARVQGVEEAVARVEHALTEDENVPAAVLTSRGCARP